MNQTMRDHRQPLWRCPKCGHRFVTRNLWHSCGRYSLAAHFKGKPKVVREIFDRFLDLARACGPVTVYAQRTRIIFQVRVRFGGAVPKKKWLEARLWLKRRAEHPCLRRVESYGRLGYGHYFRLAQTSDVDMQLAELMREAYLVGEQALQD
jgi:hypothetical protein